MGNEKGITLAETLAASVLILIMSSMLITGILGITRIISRGIELEKQAQTLELSILKDEIPQESKTIELRLMLQEGNEVTINGQIESYFTKRGDVTFQILRWN